MKKLLLILFLFSGLIFAQKAPAQHPKYIFIDSSGSMRGFIGGVYSNLLANFDEPLMMSGIRIGSYFIKRVGNKITGVPENVTISCFSNDKSLYDQSQTNLAAVADYIKRNNPSFAILITDSELDLNENVSVQESCRLGYDISCMRIKYGELIVGKNYSLTVVGFKSQYRGKLYPPTGSPIRLTRVIYKPVYIYIFASPDYINAANSFTQEILRFLGQASSKNPKIEYRAIRISPVSFPQLRLPQNYRCQEIYSRKGRLIYSVFKKGERTEDSLHCFFSRVNKMRGSEYSEVVIPLKILDPSSINGKRLVPVSLENRIEHQWENSGGYDPVKSISLQRDGLHIIFKSDLSRMRNPKRRETYPTLIVSIGYRLPEKNINIWRDWSAEDPNSDEYKNGRTLYISNFLEFLFRFYIKSVRPKERTVFTVKLSFNND